MRWPVNNEPLNTFGTLELLFPISKKDFVLVLFLFKTRLFFSIKTIVLFNYDCSIQSRQCKHLLTHKLTVAPKLT